LRTLVRKTLLGRIRRRQDSTSKFGQAAVRFVHGRHPEAAALPSLVADISLAETCSFEEFLAHVAGASTIVTTRLHVAILGHLLHRRTYLVDGSYHKFRGVFDYSMQKGSTEMLTWDGQDLVPDP
jgi:exopolysaccharide biosynthesis predicted pyruvyltransferase EpsI